MSSTRFRVLAAGTLMTAAVALGSIAASAQIRDTPGMTGCPDAKDGVVLAQPTPGGGCEQAVYNDGTRSITRGAPGAGTRGGGSRDSAPSAAPPPPPSVTSPEKKR